MPRTKRINNGATEPGTLTCALGTVAQLQDEIAWMDSLILWYRNRIDRKKIAIEEIIQGVACTVSLPIRIEMPVRTFQPKLQREPQKGQKKLVNLVQPARPQGPSVASMVRAVLPEFNGDLIDYKELRKRCYERYPEHVDKLSTGFYNTAIRLIAEGIKIGKPDSKPRKGATQVPDEPSATNGELESRV